MPGTISGPWREADLLEAVIKPGCSRLRGFKSPRRGLLTFTGSFLSALLFSNWCSELSLIMNLCQRPGRTPAHGATTKNEKLPNTLGPCYLFTSR